MPNIAPAIQEKSIHISIYIPLAKLILRAMNSLICCSSNYCCIQLSLFAFQAIEISFHQKSIKKISKEVKSNNHCNHKVGRVNAIYGAIEKARAIPRDQALKCILRQETNKRPTFVVSYDPRMPSISFITKRHYRSMVLQDRYLGNVFPEPPLIAYKRQKNLRESLIRAKLAPKNVREKRILNGMKKCGKCIVCSYVMEGNIIKKKPFYMENKQESYL